MGLNSPVHFFAQPSRPALGALLRFLPHAREASASGGLDESFDIIATVVVRDLVAGVDVPDCPNLGRMTDEIDFVVRPA